MQWVRDPGGFTSSQTGKAGRRYALDRSPSLIPPAWDEVDVAYPMNDGPVLLSDTNALIPRAYFRARVGLP